MEEIVSDRKDGMKVEGNRKGIKVNACEFELRKIL